MHIELLSAFLLGMLSILGPCTFVIVPVMAAEVNTNLKRVMSFCLGLLLSFGILGFIVALTGKVLTNFLGPWLYLGAGIITLLSGLNLLEIIRINIPNLIPARKAGNPFVMGLLYACVVLGCIGPLLATVLLYITAKASIMTALLTLLVYGAGFITPFFLFGLLITDEAVRKRIMRNALIVRRISGLLLVGVSLYLFWIVLQGVLSGVLLSGVLS